MPIMKKKVYENFTTVNNYFIDDINCKPESKGYLIYMLRKPENWNFNFKSMAKELGVGERTIRTNMKRLEDLKYLKREQTRGVNGNFEWIYYVYEEPYEKSLKNDNSPCIRFGQVDGGYIQTDKILINTNISKDKDDKENVSSFLNEEDLNPLTINLIKQDYIDITDSSLFCYEDMFNELLNSGETYRDLLTVVNYTINRLKERNYKDENGKEIKNRYAYLRNSIKFNLDKINSSYEIDDELLDYDWLKDNEEEIEI